MSVGGPQCRAQAHTPTISSDTTRQASWTERACPPHHLAPKPLALVPSRSARDLGVPLTVPCRPIDTPGRYERRGCMTGRRRRSRWRRRGRPPSGSASPSHPRCPARPREKRDSSGDCTCRADSTSLHNVAKTNFGEPTQLTHLAAVEVSPGPALPPLHRARSAAPTTSDNNRSLPSSVARSANSRSLAQRELAV